MPFMLNDMEAVERITVEAVGEPGQRVFYLQASEGIFLLTLVIEKEQARALSDAIGVILEEIEKKWPERSTPPADLAGNLDLVTPFQTQFRVGQLGLGYDDEADRLVLVAQAVVEEGREEQAAVVSMRVTRSQGRALAAHAMDVVNAGRPICPICGEPMDPRGHFCVRRNGHDA